MPAKLVSIVDTHSHIIDEWDDEDDISQYSAGSGKKKWWKCKEYGTEHRWEAKIRDRVLHNRGCPYCANRKVLSGFNDLATLYPNIAAEWHSQLNDISASEVKGTEKTQKRWWKCSKDKRHQWQAVIYSRAIDGNGCPVCSGIKIMKGINDLATLYPDIAQEWSVQNFRSANTVSPGSNKKYLWNCSHGHVWETTPESRTARGVNCHYCSGKKVFSGTNDLTTTHPEIAAEWLQKNSLFVSEFSAGSNKKAWWQCKEGHEWEAVIHNRTGKGYGCPVCSGHLVLEGINDLLTLYPNIAQEWSELNEKSCHLVSPGSHEKYKWNCKKGHTWIASVKSRTFGNTHCPKCWASSSASAAEKEIYEYVRSVLPDSVKIERNNREIIGKELDIYIPSLKVAIEYNGLYWHTEAQGKGRFYHRKKWSDCREKDIKLLTIWEDNWRDRKNGVKNTLCHKLGVSDVGTVYARKTIFMQINTKEGSDFLNLHHLQGSNKSAKHYGLIEKTTGDLVAVMSARFTKHKKELEIKRFAMSKNVPGGFSKLLKNIIRFHIEEHTENAIFGNQYSGAEKIVSYSHNDHSWGEVYEKNGFSKIHSGDPGYFYVRNNKREFRLNYSPKKFRERSDLVFEEGMSERELAILNNLYRIWDCGSARWEKEI